MSARLDRPSGSSPVAYALFAHCFTCSKDWQAVRWISQALTEHGLAVLRFDFTGLGESEGDFANTNFSSNVGDLIEAARFLEREHAAPRLLVGHSLGGAAVVQAAARLDGPSAVATIGAPADPSHVTRLLRSSVGEIQAEGHAAVELAGRTFTIRKQFLDDLEKTRMQKAVRAMEAAFLVFHAPLDDTVGIENARQLFQFARHPKSFISLGQADHLLTDKGDAQHVGAVLAAWAQRYVTDEKGQVAPDDGTESSPEEVVARTRKGFRTGVRAGEHHLVVDEPVSLGGTNEGPTPYDYLAIALGSCTTMTLRMYADRKGWPLEEAVAHVYHEKIHAKDCASCETKEGKIDRLAREIEVTGPLDEAQRDRLIQIANRCPVHRTLTSEINVQTRLREGAGRERKGRGRAVESTPDDE